MILIDANLLLYATVSDYPQHKRARAWFERVLDESPRVGLPWPSLLAFLRIITNARLFPHPLSPAAAWAHVSGWLELPNVWVPSPTERHAEVLGRIISRTSAAADLIPDAHLAALALEHGLTLCSSDRDFARFPQLRWENPLD